MWEAGENEGNQKKNVEDGGKKKIMNIIELFAKSRRKSGELQGIPILVYGRQQVDVERKGVGRLRKMYASCKGGSNRRNERSLFNHVFIFGCYMTPFVSLGV